MVVTVELHSPQHQQDQSAALPRSLLVHTHGSQQQQQQLLEGYQQQHESELQPAVILQHLPGRQQPQQQLQVPYDPEQQGLYQVSHQQRQQQQQQPYQVPYQPQQQFELPPTTAMTYSPGRQQQQLQGPYQYQQGQQQEPQEGPQQGHVQTSSLQQPEQGEHQLQAGLEDGSDPLKATRGNRSLLCKEGAAGRSGAAGPGRSPAADSSLAGLHDCQMSPLRNGLIRSVNLSRTHAR